MYVKRIQDWSWATGLIGDQDIQEHTWQKRPSSPVFFQENLQQSWNHPLIILDRMRIIFRGSWRCVSWRFRVIAPRWCSHLCLLDLLGNSWGHEAMRWATNPHEILCGKKHGAHDICHSHRSILLIGPTCQWKVGFLWGFISLNASCWSALAFAATQSVSAWAHLPLTAESQTSDQCIHANCSYCHGNYCMLVASNCSDQ